jgi:hypothetical protein
VCVCVCVCERERERERERDCVCVCVRARDQAHVACNMFFNASTCKPICPDAYQFWHGEGHWC